MPEETLGRYRIIERVGRGGMGVLYRGVDPVLDREVAIKVMSSDLASDGDEEAKTRFFREARAVAKLQHRNIVTIFEFAEENGVSFIVMEFLRGGSLAEQLRNGPGFALDRKIDIIIQLCDGLQFAHDNGVIHRDVKPANIWLLEDGSVKLLDFGIAKLLSSTFTRTGDVLGSAAYMSPEQIEGRPVDGRADVFSTAVVLYELLAGRKPFEADSATATILKVLHEAPHPPLETAAGALPSALVAAVAKALEKDPKNRYQSASALGDDLRRIRAALARGEAPMVGASTQDETMWAPSAAQPVLTDLSLHGDQSQVARTSRRPRSSRWLIAAAVGAIAVAGGIWFAVTRAPNPQPATRDSAGGSVALAPAVAPIAATEASSDVNTTSPPTAKVGPKGTTDDVRPTTSAVPPGSAAEPSGARRAGPAPSAARLRVTSMPNAAAIEIDGGRTGLQTPADLTIEGALPKRLRLTKEGFEPIDVRLTQAAVERGLVSYKLTPATPVMVTVTASGSYPFEITDGKQVLSAAAMSHELAVQRSLTLHLIAPTYLLDYVFKAGTGAGQTLEVRAPELGRLTIRSAMETCLVNVNGHELGFPPVNAQLLAAGPYTIQLKCPDGQLVRGSSVTVVAGQTVIAKVP